MTAQREGVSIQGDGLVVRTWEASDLPHLARWSHRAGVRRVFDLWLETPEQQASVFAWVHQHAGNLHLLAVENGRPVGRTSVDMSAPRLARLWAIHVPPEHEGRGVAHRMLRALLPWLQEQGYKVRLEVDVFNKRAQRLYAGLGFREVGRRFVPMTITSSPADIAELDAAGPGAYRRTAHGYELAQIVLELPS